MTGSRRTLYDVLGVRPNATAATIRQSYLHLARLVHPDRHQHSTPAERTLAERRMREVTAAWAVLGDAASRAGYDREIAPARPPKGTSAQDSAGSNSKRPSRGTYHDGFEDDDAESNDAENVDEEDGIEVSAAVYHLVTKGPLFALIGLAVLILVFTAYARPSENDPTTPGSTSWTTIGIDPNR